MEQPITAFFDEECESLTKMFSTEDADFMLQQLHGSELFSASAGGCDASLFFPAPASFWPVSQGGSMEDVAGAEVGVGESFHCYDDHYYTNFQNVSQESSHSSGSDNNSVAFSNLANDINIFQMLNDSSESIDFSAMDEKNYDYNTSVVPVILPGAIIEENQPASIADPKRKFAKAEQQTEAEETPKKKARVSRNAQKNKRNVQPKPKKNQKTAKEDEETNTNTLQNGQSSCSYSSEDDSNASQESNGGEGSDNKESAALNLNGKARASRGSATDPQSLYARRRRERINERLRILQNLIPNGTKVDISTMLEEAVHYVKFLQLQIKLLSSDDMWMYAPIVYNGLDIGLYGRIFSTQ